jgi:LPXTG-motif cell wall-anchored protein
VSVKTFRLFVRRLVILATATTLGTAAVIALSATPAHAHDMVITKSYECDKRTGNWVVTWTVKNSQNNKFATLTAVSHLPADTPLTVIVVGAVLPKPQGSISGVQTVPGSATSAKLAVTAEWEKIAADGYKKVVRSAEKRIYFEGKCEQDKPEFEATPTSDCDSISVTVTNTGKIDITGTVSSGNDSRPLSLAPNATSEPFEFPGGDGVTVTVAVQGADSKTFTWQKPEDCPTPTTPPPTTTTPDLPVTGASLSTLIGVGGALVLVGVALLMVLRYRRRLGES